MQRSPSGRPLSVGAEILGQFPLHPSPAIGHTYPSGWGADQLLVTEHVWKRGFRRHVLAVGHQDQRRTVFILAAKASTSVWLFLRSQEKASVWRYSPLSSVKEIPKAPLY